MMTAARGGETRRSAETKWPNPPRRAGAALIQRTDKVRHAEIRIGIVATPNYSRDGISPRSSEVVVTPLDVNLERRGAEDVQRLGGHRGTRERGRDPGKLTSPILFSGVGSKPLRRAR